MPRGIDLEDIKWHVVSTAPIANPCVKDNETGKREKNEDGSCKYGKENPDWPEGYSYLDRFLEETKSIFCIKFICYIKILFNKKRYK